MEIHHIGYLVKNMEKSILAFQQLGFVVEGKVVFDEYRGIDIQFMKNAEYRIELVSPVTAESVVADLLKKNGTGPYHICYYCDDIEAEIERLRGEGYTPTGEAAAAIALGNHKVCFLFNRKVGLIELFER